MKPTRAKRHLLIPAYRLVVAAIPVLALGNFANAVTYLLDTTDDMWWRAPFTLLLAVYLGFWCWPAQRAELAKMEAARLKDRAGGAA